MTWNVAATISEAPHNILNTKCMTFLAEPAAQVVGSMPAASLRYIYECLSSDEPPIRRTCIPWKRRWSTRLKTVATSKHQRKNETRHFGVVSDDFNINAAQKPDTCGFEDSTSCGSAETLRRGFLQRVRRMRLVTIPGDVPFFALSHVHTVTRGHSKTNMVVSQPVQL